jgi:hypothetical protein
MDSAYATGRGPVYAATHHAWHSRKALKRLFGYLSGAWGSKEVAEVRFIQSPRRCLPCSYGLEPPKAYLTGPFLVRYGLGAPRHARERFRSDKYPTMMVERSLSIESLTRQVFD